MKPGLPIDEVLLALREALVTHQSVVLQAPPGAGKSTVVPLALLDEPWMKGQRVLMLEPRRLAARAVASRMSQTLRESVGRTVGYRMRMDTRVSGDTRIEVVTEGVLTRMLQADPALEGYGVVIFDEFHERSLNADLGLALTVDGRESLGSQLKVLVMSATLDGEAVARLLGNAPIVTANGRTYPVETRFTGKGLPILPWSGPGPPGANESPERVATQLVRRALREEEGDVLVFLPGAREIRRVQGDLSDVDPTTRVLPLFGDLSADDQDTALAPSATGQRKVVLATNIAETSLTIQGVRVVVDSGLVRRSVFDPATGMSRLETQRVSRASADQRQGRAGRLGPGVCYRAWSEGSHRTLAAYSPPEILDADLVPLALDLANWGARDASELRWLDSPPAATLDSARDLLTHLGALDANGRITPHGKDVAGLGVHPRLAHMLLRARELGWVETASQLAALLSERDVLRWASATRDSDVTTRLDVLRRSGETGGVDRNSLQRARRAAEDLARVAGGGSGTSGSGAATRAGRPLEGGGANVAGVLLAFAYPDRIGRRRGDTQSRYTLSNGRGAHFAEVQSLAKNEFIVAVDLDDRDRDARILLAAAITRSDIELYLSERLQRFESVTWNSREQAVIASRVIKLDALVLEEKPLTPMPAEAAREAMLAGVREMGLDALPWDRDARDLQARIEFVRQMTAGSAVGAGGPDDGSGGRPPGSAAGRAGNWPQVSDSALFETIDTWLPAWLEGVTRRGHLARLSMTDILRGILTWEQQKALDQLAPTHLQVPSGSRIRVDYLDESAPAVSVRLQEVFGLQDTPKLVGGRAPVTFKLLSPAQRPVQVTKDLAGFWRGSYADVRKDMRGRYPKHYWPENPLEAEPTRGARRRT